MPKEESAAAAVTSSAEHGPPPPLADDPKQNVAYTPAWVMDNGAPEGEGSYTEEKVEYRDEQGNLLNDEQVAALQGKVSFSTRYETRTRLVDEQGNEIYNEVVGNGDGVAGTIADGVDPGTVNPQGEGQASPEPPTVGVNDDLNKEARVEDAKATAEPESEAGKQTGKDEL